MNKPFSPVLVLWVCAAVAQVLIPSPEPTFWKGTRLWNTKACLLTRTHTLHTRTRYPTPQTAKAAKAAKRIIIPSGSEEGVFRWALKLFPSGRKGSSSHYTSLESNLPLFFFFFFFFVRGSEVNFRLSAHMQVLSPRADCRSTLLKSLKQRTYSQLHALKKSPFSNGAFLFRGHAFREKGPFYGCALKNNSFVERWTAFQFYLSKNHSCMG